MCLPLALIDVYDTGDQGQIWEGSRVPWNPLSTTGFGARNPLAPSWTARGLKKIAKEYMEISSINSRSTPAGDHHGLLYGVNSTDIEILVVCSD